MSSAAIFALYLFFLSTEYFKGVHMRRRLVRSLAKEIKTHAVFLLLPITVY